jgi:hypothetical protein
MIFCAGILPAQTQPAVPAGDLQPLLANLDEVTTSTRVSLAKLRIEKWKTQSEVKQRLQSDAQAIDRNLSEAVPALVEKLHAEPQSLASNFAMYRNLDAVHDVLNLLTQTAGAVAPDDEYSALANNAGRLDDLRKAFADRMENLAASKDAEIARLQSAGPVEAKGQPAPPPKKIIVDDTAPAKKPATKKRKAQ